MRAIALLFSGVAFCLATPAAEAKVTWFWDGPASTPATILTQITASMNEAIDYYNAHGEYDWSEYSTNAQGIRVIYDEAVPTANANYRGRISFGGSRGVSTAMHEMGHIFGVGTFEPTWTQLITAGKWTGSAALAEVRRFDGPSASLNADTSHFWPYGLNFSTEDSIENRRRHVRMIGALRSDMRLSNGNATELAGDYNNDGVTDAADYTEWRDRNGDSTSLVNDRTIGAVDASDYAWWKRGYGGSVSSVSSATTVPEPDALLAALFAALGITITIRGFSSPTNLPRR